MHAFVMTCFWIYAITAGINMLAALVTDDGAGAQVKFFVRFIINLPMTLWAAYLLWG